MNNLESIETRSQVFEKLTQLISMLTEEEMAILCLVINSIQMEKNISVRKDN